MNYRRLYDALIAKAISHQRKKGSVHYYERHHILPRSLGGSDAPANLVLLTAKEHFVAHHLLFKSAPEVAQLQRAFWMMCQSAMADGFSYASALVYERTRLGVASRFRHSDATREKIASAGIGRGHTTQAKEKIRAAMRGRIASEETRRRIRAAKTGATTPSEVRQKMSAAHRGKVKTPEHREKLRLSSLGEKSHRFGLHWFTDGVTSVMTKECPPGFAPGRTKGG